MLNVLTYLLILSNKILSIFIRKNKEITKKKEDINKDIPSSNNNEEDITNIFDRINRL